MKKTKKYKDGGNLFLSMAGGGSMGTIPSMYGELPEYLVGGPGDPENPYVVNGYRQFGGDGDDSQMSADQDFYSKKLNAFINKIRENDEKGRMQEYERIMEEGMPEEAMELEARYGLQMPAYNPYQTQDLYDGSNLNLYANAVNGAKGISQGLSDFKNRARLFGPKVQYYNIKNKFHEGYSPDVLKAQEEMNEKLNQMNNGFAYGGQNLPKAQLGLEQFKKNNQTILSSPAFQPIDFNNIGSGSTSDGTGSNNTTGNQTVTINGQQFLIGPDGQLYAPFTGGGYANPNMLYNGYNDYRGNMNMPYLNFRSRNRLTGDFRDAMMAGMYNDSQLTASMVNSRRALLPGNRVKSMIYQFGELPTGTGTGVGTSGAGTQPGAEYTDQDPGKGFFGRLFGNRYNDPRFDPGTDNAGNPDIERTDLTSQFNPTAKSEYDVFRPRRAERVSDRLENVGNKLDRMYGYNQYMEDARNAYGEEDTNYTFSERERNRLGRLTKKYNRIATKEGRPERPKYTEPEVQKNGGSLPGYQGIFGSSSVGGLNVKMPSLPDSLANDPYLFSAMAGNFNPTFDSNQIDYSASNPALPGHKKWQQDEEELNNDPYYVEQKTKKKTLFNPERFLAKERFLTNFLDQANNRRMADQLAEASQSGNVFNDLPMSRGFYNPQSGKFMGDVPVFNTGFSGYMQNGGSIIDSLKEGDEVPLTEEQIKELEKRGITFSYLD